MKRRMILPALVVAVLCGACTTMGPKSIRSARVNYNRAIIDTRSEQMLTNLVRLHYRDPVYFLEISSVSTQYVLGAGGSADIGSIGESEIGGIGGTVAYEERPTVMYLPLQGDEFVKRLLSPVPMESIVLLTQTGWRIDRILRCCVVQVNDLKNAPTASGPTPDRPPTFDRYLEMAQTLEALRQAEVLEVRFRRVEPGEEPPVVPLEVGDDEYLLSVIFRTEPGTTEHEQVARLRELLDLDPNFNEFYLTKNPTFRGRQEIGILPRSLLGAMSYLSQAVEPPQRDVDAGRVTVTRNPDGSEFNWETLTGGLLQIRSSATRPEGAFIRVQYRGTWFYIDDADLTSKSTFNLLDLLFQLQAGNSTGEGPVLTLPLN
jgi:hypothetical protein